MDYGGGGGFGDGGPSPSQGRGAGGGGGSSGRKSYDEQTIQPVTVQMCLTSHPDEEGGSGGEQLTDGRKLYHVKIVGAVRTYEDFSTNCLYGIEDGTGLIDVKQWIDSNDCSAMAELRQSCAKEGIYLTIVGQIKDYDGKKTIVADSIRPILTGNEITHHILEVVYAGEMHKKMCANPYGVAQGIGFGATSVAKGVPLQQQYGNNSNDSLRDIVLTFIRTEGMYSEAGANVPLCVQQLDGKYNEREIRSMIEDLAAEGHIYSTIDENNYKFAM
jgi:replication factor A2